MADLRLKITTDWNDTQAALGNMKKSLNAVRRELVDAQGDTSKLGTAEKLYSDTLSYNLEKIKATETGTKSLRDQQKLLTKELFELNSALGSAGNVYSDSFRQSLESIKGEMEKLAPAVNEASDEFKDLEPEVKGANDVMEKGKASVKGYLSRLVELTKNILVFQLILGPIRKGVGFLSQTISDSTKYAAEAEQVFSKLSTVFLGLEDSAKRAASSISSNLGVANSTAASALSTVGDLLQAQGMGTSSSLDMASEWVSKFQDIIAFKDINMSLEEFAQNFMSGAAGNLRNFRTFGSIVKESSVNARLASQGLDKLTGSQLELAKMTARAELALEQQANAMGATKREWETTLSVNRRLTEAWKEYKELLGESINETLKPAKSWLADILDYANDVTKAIKEINNGEFTIKVQQETTDEFLSRIGAIMGRVGTASEGENASGFWGNLWAGLQQSVAMRDPIAAERVYEETHTLTAKQISEIMLSTGATIEQMIEAANAYGFSLSEDNAKEGKRLYDQKKAEIELQENLNRQWLSVAELMDSVIASVGEISTNISMGGYDSYLSEIAGLTNPSTQGELDDWIVELSTTFDSAILKAIETLGAGSLDAYQDPFSQLTGNASDIEGFGKKMNDLQSLYELISNYGVSSGTDVSSYLEAILRYYFKAAEDKAKLEAEELRKTNYANGLSSITGNTSSYLNQLNQFGMSEDEKALDDLWLAYDALISVVGESDELKSAYEDQVEALTLLQGKQKEYNDQLEKESKLKEIQSGTEDYLKQWRQVGMSDYEKVIDDLTQSLTGDYELDAAINDQIDAFKALTMATEELEKEEAMRAAWAGVRDKALGAMGTVGSAIQTFTDGEGDIWTDILTVLLDIFQQSEYWDEVVSILNEVIEPLLPLVGMIVSILHSLSPVFELIAGVIKIIASAVAIVLGGINEILVLFKGLWTNLLTFFKNVPIWIYNATHVRDKATYAFVDIGAELARVQAETNETLKDIWTEEKKQNEQADLRFLQELLRAGIIDEAGYNARAGVKQAGLSWDTVAGSSASGYVDWSNRGANVVTNRVNITIEGNVTEDGLGELERILSKYYGLQPSGAAY